MVLVTNFEKKTYRNATERSLVYRGMKSLLRKKAKKPSKKEVKARLELNDYASKISLAQQDAMQVRRGPRLKGSGTRITLHDGGGLVVGVGGWWWGGGGDPSRRWRV
jgi:hypothetical protein